MGSHTRLLRSMKDAWGSSHKKITAVNSWSPSRFQTEERRERQIYGPTTSVWWNVLAWVCGLIVTLASVVTTDASPYHMGPVRVVWCAERLTCASTVLTRILLVVSKMSAGAIYVVLAFTFATMAHSTASYLGKKPQIVVSETGLFGTMHSRAAHFRGGMAIAVLGVVHTAAHLGRYALNGDLSWALRVPMVIAGLVATVVFVLLSPSGARKKRIEAILDCLCCCFRRKRSKKKPGPERISHETWMMVSHHLLACLALVAGAVHHPRFAVAILVITVLWSLDRLYLKLCRTYLVEAPHFVAVVGRPAEDDSDDDERASGTLVAFANPAGFEYETGDFVKIRFPWLAGELGKQEHPFSLAPIGNKGKNRSMLYAAIYGDWTRALWHTVRRCGNGFGRPMLLIGPYSAPFNTSFTHNFVFVVASGVGITPILSVVERFGSTRHIVVLWICRDAALLRLYADYLRERCHSHIYFTGPSSEDICTDLQRDLAPLAVCFGRPDVQTIATAVLTCTPLPRCNTPDETKTPPPRQGLKDIEIGVDYFPDDDGEHAPPHLDDGPTSSKRPLAPLWTPPRPCSWIKKSASSPKAPLPKLSTIELTGTRCLDEMPVAPHEWRVLYCGGSKHISDCLKDVCTDLGASYACESFWL